MSLSELSVRRPVFATMIVMSLVVMGIFSFRDLGVDLFPQADPATVTVSVQLPGASPAEMATAVVEPLEEALSSISGIDEMLAQRISEGSATVTLRFVLERDINDAANDVREKVSGAMRNLPPQVLPPVIQKVDPDSDPIMSVVLSSDTMSLRTLTELADKQVKRAIETVNGVGQVDLGGGRAREIHVVVDIEKLNGHGLTIEHVREAIAAENIEVPGGTVEQGKSEILLRTLGRVDAAEEFNHLIVATMAGTPIRISDIGYAEDTTERPRQAVWLGGSPAVMLDVRRATGENTIAVVEGVKARLDQVRRTLPKEATLTVTRDDSKFIYGAIASLEEHLVWGSFLAGLVVMFFIRNLRDHRRQFHAVVGRDQLAARRARAPGPRSAATHPIRRDPGCPCRHRRCRSRTSGNSPMVAMMSMRDHGWCRLRLGLVLARQADQPHAAHALHGNEEIDGTEYRPPAITGRFHPLEAIERQRCVASGGQ